MDLMGWLAGNVGFIIVYAGMIIFGLVAYAYIIPYFVVRRLRKMVASGEASQWIAKMVPELLSMELTVKRDDGTEEKVPLVNFLVSIAIQNLKMQFNSLKSSFIRGVMSGEEGTGFDLNQIEKLIDQVPKKWRWAAQLFGPLVFKKMVTGTTTGAGASVVSKGL